MTSTMKKGKNEKKIYKRYFGFLNSIGLHRAANEGNPEQVKAVLLSNVNVNDRSGSKNEMTALETGCRFGYIDVVKVLLDDESIFPGKCLFVASRNGHLDIIRLLLKRMPYLSIHSRNTDKRTPFDVANESNQVHILKYFLELGYDPQNLLFEKIKKRLRDFRYFQPKLFSNWRDARALIQDDKKITTLLVSDLTDMVLPKDIIKIVSLFIFNPQVTNIYEKSQQKKTKPTTTQQ